MCHQGGCRRGEFWVVLSKWVRVLEAGQRCINPASVQILTGRAVTGARGSGSVGVSARDLVAASSREGSKEIFGSADGKVLRDRPLAARPLMAHPRVFVSDKTEDVETSA